MDQGASAARKKSDRMQQRCGWVCRKGRELASGGLENKRGGTLFPVNLLGRIWGERTSCECKAVWLAERAVKLLTSRKKEEGGVGTFG